MKRLQRLIARMLGVEELWLLRERGLISTRDYHTFAENYNECLRRGFIRVSPTTADRTEG